MENPTPQKFTIIPGVEVISLNLAIEGMGETIKVLVLDQDEIPGEFLDEAGEPRFEDLFDLAAPLVFDGAEEVATEADGVLPVDMEVLGTADVPVTPEANEEVQVFSAGFLVLDKAAIPAQFFDESGEACIEAFLTAGMAEMLVPDHEALPDPEDTTLTIELTDNEANLTEATTLFGRKVDLASMGS